MKALYRICISVTYYQYRLIWLKKKMPELMFFLIVFFGKSKYLIKQHGQNTQDDNAEHDIIQTEDLTAVDNQISQAGIGRQKFTDDDTYEAESDIHLHVADDGGNAGGQNDIAKNIPAGASQSPDEQQFIIVYVDKSSIQVDDRAEYGHCDTADNDGFHVVAEPYDQDRCQSGFWQAVQYNKVRF